MGMAARLWLLVMCDGEDKREEQYEMSDCMLNGTGVSTFTPAAATNIVVTQRWR
jgi:hypothetical protein